jgi:PAS domain S-box-containing protein
MRSVNNNTFNFLSGGGDVGKRIQSYNWSETPLGPIESWPQSLLTTVSLCLASNFPISMAWGAGHVQIYNDGYVPICGAQHPRSMGQDFRECWASAWPEIGEAYDHAWAGGSSFIENKRTFVTRNGYLEEAFFTFSFSPIRDETGEVGGIFHPVTEKTVEMLSERRTRALRDLAARTGEAKSIEEVFTLAAGTLSDYKLDLPFALFYRLDDKGTQARLAASSGLMPGSAASPELVDVETSGAWPFADLLRSSQIIQVDELERRFGPLQCEPYPEFPTEGLVLPISSPGSERPCAIFVAGVSPRLALNEGYRNFYDMLASNLNAAVANAQAYEEERRRAEALAEIDRAKTAFFSNVSHEFRTPLTLLLGPIEDVLGRNENQEEGRELLHVAHRNALRLQKLVNTLLDFSRIEAGRVQATYRPTDLSPFTAELASNFRSAIEKAGLKLRVDCDPLPEPVYIDRDLWEKVVLNLLSNAFKHTFEGEIKVRMRWQDERVELVVQDTGVGIPAGQLPYLFERFHQVPNARSRTHEGSGIGLALVNELVKLHGGTITVESVVDGGTSFTVSIPGGKAHLPANSIDAETTLSSTALGIQPFVEEALRWLPQEGREGLRIPSNSHASVLEAEIWPSTSPGSKAKARILLADDNADMREYVRRLLEAHCEVEAVSNGKAALHAAKANPPDLILSDVMMPEMDGFELLAALRGNSDLQRIPIIMLSARAGEEAKVEGLQVGADDYLSKPFSARELLARVRTNLDLHRVRREGIHALQKSLEREKLVADIVEGIRSETDLETVLQKTAATLGHFTKADRCTIWLYNSDKKQFLVPENEYRSSEEIERIADTAFPYNPVLPFNLSQQEVIHLSDILESEGLTDEDRQMITERDIKSLLHVPVLYEKKLLGVLRIHTVREKQEWNAETVGVVEQVAGQVAVVIHKAALMQELKESEALKTAILESSLDAIVTMDHQGKVVDWNVAAERLFGYARTEAIGRGMAELIIPERFREAHYKGLARFQATGEGRVINKLIEIPALRADGSEFLSELTISLIPTEGAPMFTGTLRDISERKQAELALQESEERFSSIFNQSAVGIAETDLTGRFVLVNERYCEMVGRSKEELYQTRMQDISHPEDLSGNIALFQRAIKEGVPFKIEKRYIRPDGSEIWVSNNVSLLKDTEGKPLYIVAVSQDITEQKRAKRALQESEERFRNMADAAPVIIWMGNTKGENIYFNPAWLRLTGREYEEEAKLGWEEVVHPDDIGYTREVYEDALKNAAPFRVEFRLRRYDNEYCLLNCQGSPRHSSSGEFLGFVGVCEDITERKKAEESIKYQSYLMQSITDNATAGLFMMDVNGICTFMNPAAEEISGLTFEEIKQYPEKPLHDWIHYLRPDGTPYPMCECPIDRALPENNDIRAHEDVFVRRDGTLYNVSCAARPIIKEGVPVGTLVEVRDITERKKAEQAIKESEEHFRTFANNIQNLAWMSNPDGRSFWYNQRWYDYTGTTLEEMQARGWEKAHHPDHIDRVLDFLKEALGKGETWEITFPLRGADGKYRWFLTRAYPVKDAEGKVLRWIGTNTNIDDQKRAEQQLQSISEELAAANEEIQASNEELSASNQQLMRINSDLDNFVYTASHDLKAPISNIEGLMNALNKFISEESKTNEKVKTIMGLTYNSINRFKETIKDLTDIAKVQSDGEEDLSELSFKEMLEDVKLNIQPLIDESDARFNEDFSQAPGIYFSKKNLRSILYNLVSNAIKYRSPDRPVNICVTSSRPDHAHILLSVQDNGLGIKEDDKPKVFMMFKRLHQHVEGTGIGMAIVKKIIDNNGGKIEVESEVGQGTTFKIYFKVN